MLSLLALMLMLGVANWFATTLLVESEIFRPVRGWVRNQYDKATGPRSAAVWSKLHYLVSCHMCAGTWVALAMALFAPAVVSVPVIGWLLTALVIKGIGHLVLLLVNMGNARVELDRAQATEAMMGAIPNLESMLGGLMNRHEARVDAANDRNKQGRHDQASAYMFGDMGRMPTKKGPKFEPFKEGDLLEPVEPQPSWNKPETKF